MTHYEKVNKWLVPLESHGCIGVEIGAFKTPIPRITPIYVDKYREYAYESCLFDVLGDATSLPFPDNSLGYVATSHVLEHVANPVQALAEWYRVIRPGGIIYMVVPDRRYTWDYNRQLTSVSHMLTDFKNGVTPADPTHISDFVDLIDWRSYSPSTPPEMVREKKQELKSVYNKAVASGNEINIHFHVFEPSNIVSLIEELKTFDGTRFRWRLVDSVERFPRDNPNGFLAIIRIEKTFTEKMKFLPTTLANFVLGKCLHRDRSRPTRSKLMEIACNGYTNRGNKH